MRPGVNLTKFIADHWTQDSQPIPSGPRVPNMSESSTTDKLRFAIKIINEESNPDLTIRSKAIERCYDLLQKCSDDDILKLGTEILQLPIPENRKPFKFTFENGQSITLQWPQMEALKRKSDYFKKLENESMTEGQTRKALLKQVTPDEFTQFLRYTFQPELILTRQDAYEALVLSHEFMVDSPKSEQMLMSAINEMDIEDPSEDDLIVINQLMQISPKLCSEILNRLPARYAEILYSIPQLNHPEMNNALSRYVLKVLMDPTIKLDFSRLDIRKLNFNPYPVTNEWLAKLKGLESLLELDLSGTGIKNCDVISQFTNLKILSLAYNTGFNTAGINSLVNLEQLDLVDTGINSINDFVSLKEHLKRLDLSENENINLTGIHELSGLEELGLSRTNLQALGDIAQLKHLRRLHLEYNSGLNLTGIGHLENLHELNLAEIGLTTLGDMVKLKKLQKLYVGRNPGLDLKDIESFPDLQELDVQRSDIAVLGNIVKLKKLRVLNLRENRNLNLATIKLLANLEVLNVSETDLAGLGEILDLEGLKSLDVSRNDRINLAGLERLQKLEELNVRKVDLRILELVQQLINLRILDISHNENLNNFNGINRLENLEELKATSLLIQGLGDACDLRKLKTLNLMNCLGMNLNGVERLESLEDLDLSNTGTTQLGSVVDLPNLRRLVLNGNQGVSLENIQRMLRLRSLDVSNTNTTHLGNIADLKGLQLLDLAFNEDLNLDGITRLSALRILTLFMSVPRIYLPLPVLIVALDPKE